jgi:hypothetical protein
MPKLKPGVQYSAMTARADGIPPDIRSPVKVRLPLPFPADSHDWVATEALWDTGATNSVISNDFAARLKLPVVSKATTIGIHGPKEVDVFMIDILLMDRVNFQGWLVSSGDTGPTTPDMIIGMDIITKGDFTFMNGPDGYVFSFIVPSLLEPTDFRTYIQRYNDEMNWKSRNTGAQAEYRANTRARKKDRKKR